MQTEKKYSKKQREFIELYMSQNLIRLSSEARELENKFEAAISEAYSDAYAHANHQKRDLLRSEIDFYEYLDKLKSGAKNGTKYDCDMEAILSAIENLGREAINEKFEDAHNTLKCEQQETYREYDLPGSGYFVHLLNQPLIDYNILDAIVMSIVMGAAGFIIFVLLKL